MSLDPFPEVRALSQHGALDVRFCPRRENGHNSTLQSACAEAHHVLRKVVPEHCYGYHDPADTPETVRRNTACLSGIVGEYFGHDRRPDDDRRLILLIAPCGSPWAVSSTIAHQLLARRETHAGKAP
jgi:hypothetical protein